MIIDLGVLGEVKLEFFNYYWEEFDIFITHQGFTMSGIRVYLIAHPLNPDLYHNHTIINNAIVIPYSHTKEIQ